MRFKIALARAQSKTRTAAMTNCPVVTLNELNPPTRGLYTFMRLPVADADGRHMFGGRLVYDGVVTVTRRAYYSHRTVKRALAQQMLSMLQTPFTQDNARPCSDAIAIPTPRPRRPPPDPLPVDVFLPVVYQVNAHSVKARIDDGSVVTVSGAACESLCVVGTRFELRITAQK